MSPTKALTAGMLAVLAGSGLAGCGRMADNTSLYSVHQPVVERSNYTIDLRTGPGGLPVGEEGRLAGWLEAMDLKYGDRLAIEDPAMSPATRDEIARLAAKHGILLSEGAPVTPGYVEPGSARVVLTRTTASVPGCPDWSVKTDFNPRNGNSSNYGCAVNSNLAAMVADPEDLVRGQDGTEQQLIYGASRAVAKGQAPSTSGSAGGGTSGGSGGISLGGSGD
ncbi:CpaD family pilus assembly protein [Erythrobacter sp. LQ02-29]|uniref:CpaD family pilus assembly protein n=1 Tax=unclassified Erythrobacter TaxID=2633097 RepID=UPI001BFC480D|nr:MULTISPECIES: CpaD family pilus assembly protein [unclassified Erythrobacter]MCP9222480.1 CpaD family pilus assembly protein [Erythrobacter sp. LQ02-29]QWC56231.1 pilus assembly protein CpaD [Erythrobacter sp. 3-20A1M]